MAQPTVGTTAPAFDLPTGDGKTLSLRDLRGKYIVLYFYPKDNTPGCTREACSFQENLKAIERSGAVVVGVSPDKPESHGRFAEKYNLTFPLVSDTDKDIVRKYGVWKQKNFLGKKFMGVERTTFIIDEKGTIVHVFPQVKVDGHTEEVLSVLNELKNR
jgi:peroxiredoxin Q/BCP